MRRFDLEKQRTWKKHIESWQASGISGKQWSKDHKIPSGTFYYWKSKFLPGLKLSKRSFIEIPQEKTTRIEIELQGVKIFVEKDFDKQTLVRCLQALRSCQC